MWILGVETSALEGGVALMQDGRPAGVRPLEAGGTRGAALVPAVRSLLGEAGIAPSDLGLAAVDVGPGSFTGTRVGVAFAKVLGYAAGVPLAAVSGLEARAIEAARAGASGALAVVLDARRGRFYVALFHAENGQVRRLMDDRLLAEAEIPSSDLRLGEFPVPSALTIARLGAAAPRVPPLALAPAYLRGVEAQEKRSR